MQREQLEVLRWLKDLDRLRITALETPDKPTVFECKFFYSRLKSKTYTHLGIIEANKPNIGKVPAMLGVHFLDLVILQRKLQRYISEMTDTRCNDDPGLRFNVFDEHVGNIKTVIERIAAQIKTLPETTMLTIEY